MRESEIEAHYAKLVDEADGLFFKFTSPQNSGVPDRLVLLPNGKCYFVEFKAPNKKPRRLQKVVFNMIRKRGFEVKVIDEKVDKL